jgi:hypothetical protein
MSQAPEPATGGEITLEITDAAGARQLRAFPRGVIYIGRTSACDLQLRDLGVEGVHAILDMEPSPSLSDLSSREGPTINGARAPLGALKDGDSFQLGPYSIRVFFSWLHTPPAPGALVAQLYQHERLASERVILASGLVIDGRGTLRDFDGAHPVLRLDPVRAGRVRARLYTRASLFYEGAPYADQELAPGAHLYLFDWRVHITQGDAPREASPQVWRGVAEAPGDLPLYAAPIALVRVGHRARREVWRSLYSRGFFLRTEQGTLEVRPGRGATFSAAPLHQRPAADNRDALAEMLCAPLRHRLPGAILFSATGEMILSGDEVEVRGYPIDEAFSPDTGGPRVAAARRIARVVASEVRAVPRAPLGLWSRLRAWFWA